MTGISSSCCTSGSGSKSKSPYDLTIAFIGNPSVGKSVFFSRLTGVGVEISNYPGTTVALKRGIVKARGKTIEIVDLPGIYSLGVTNEDEKVTKKFLIEDRPDVIINVVDASRLERNLYLTLQLLELDIPMVVALNQVDLAADLGILVDKDGLSELLGLPVVPTVATWGIGLDEVMLVALDEQNKNQEHHQVKYSQWIRQALSSLDYVFPNIPPIVKMAALLNDAEFVELCCMPPEANALLSSARRLRQNLEIEQGISVPDTVARDLYGETGYIVNSWN